MRAAISAFVILLLAASASAQAAACKLEGSDQWESQFDLSSLSIPITIDTRVSYDGAGSFRSTSSYEGDCHIEANGTYSYLEPELIVESVTVGKARPNPTSVPCELLHVASLAIGEDSLLPSSNITFSDDCKTFNMTFYDSVGIPRTRQFVEFSPALIVIPSILVFFVASFALLF